MTRSYVRYIKTLIKRLYGYTMDSDLSDYSYDSLPCAYKSEDCPVRTIQLSPASCISPGLSERFTDETSDVLFVNDSKEELRLHRTVLAVNSPVFFTMFEGEWKEKNAKSVPLGEGVNWEAFSIAVNLLYGIATDVTPSCLLEVYKIANMYDLASVKSSIAECIPKMDVEDVISLSVLAGQLEDHDLESGVIYQATLKSFTANCERLSHCDEVVQLSYNVMTWLAQSDKVTVSEIDLYRILIRWAEENEDLSYKKMQNLFSHIRYDTIARWLLTSEVAGGICNRSKFAEALKHYERLTVGAIWSNIESFRPRESQKIPLNVYPMSPDLGVIADSEKTTFYRVADKDALGIIYFGKEYKSLDITIDRDSYHGSVQMNFSLENLTSEKSKKGSFSCSCQIDISEYYQEPKISVKYTKFRLTLTPSGVRVLSRSAVGKNGYFTCERQLPNASYQKFPWLIRFGCEQTGKSCSDSNRLMHLTCRVIN